MAKFLLLAAVFLAGACSEPPRLSRSPDGVKNPDRTPMAARVGRIVTDGEDSWEEWVSGLGPPGRQASLPINNPPIVRGADATHMRDEDHVVGVLVEGHPRAYPWWILSSGHLVNDLVEGVPVLVTMCERCSGSSAFHPVHEGFPLDFRLAGFRNGTWFCRDYQTGSFWHPFAGESWKGPLEGTELERYPSFQATWAEWYGAHPDTTVLLGSQEMRYRRHARWGEDAKHPGAEHTIEPPGLAVDDGAAGQRDLLPRNTLLYGLKYGRGRAFLLEDLRERGGVVQERLEDVPVVLILSGEVQVGAFVARSSGRDLDLSVVSAEPLMLEDAQGTRWDPWGRAVSGPGQGAVLEPADGYLTEWYEWVQQRPDTTVHGRP